MSGATEPCATLPRLFVALRVPADVAQVLGRVAAGLRSRTSPAAFRWVDPSAYHVTLRFLGDVAPDRTDALIHALRAGEASGAPIEVVASGLGAFPRTLRPRVLHVPLAGAEGRLEALARRVARASAGFGSAAPEPSFVPHVTIARADRPTRLDDEVVARTIASSVGRRHGVWTAGSFELVRSERGSGGARYVTIATLSS